MEKQAPRNANTVADFKRPPSWTATGRRMCSAKEAVDRAGRIDGGVAEKKILLRFLHVLDRTWII
jgi:hypothetical protein